VLVLDRLLVFIVVVIMMVIMVVVMIVVIIVVVVVVIVRLLILVLRDCVLLLNALNHRVEARQQWSSGLLVAALYVKLGLDFARQRFFKRQFTHLDMGTRVIREKQGLISSVLLYPFPKSVVRD
jgi:hypothetical protein